MRDELSAKDAQRAAGEWVLGRAVGEQMRTGGPAGRGYRAYCYACYQHGLRPRSPRTFYRRLNQQVALSVVLRVPQPIHRAYVERAMRQWARRSPLARVEALMTEFARERRVASRLPAAVTLVALRQLIGDLLDTYLPVTNPATDDRADG